LLPDGIAIQLLQNAKIIIQVHYYPVGRTGEDQTRIGLYFSKQPVQQRLFQIPVLNQTFKIPADAESYDVKASLTIPLFLDSHAIWIYPHMHLLGRKIKVDVLDRDKTVYAADLRERLEFQLAGLLHLQGIGSGHLWLHRPPHLHVQ